MGPLAMMKPDDAVLRAADRILARAAELGPSMAADRALVVALLEVSPSSLAASDELWRQESIGKRAAREAATLANAALGNVRAIAAGLDVAIYRRSDWDQDGDFGFEVQRGPHRVPVIMPPLPGAKWEFERCHVDGNSWMWKYAPGILRDALGIKETYER